MASILESTLNSRFLSGGNIDSRRYIRSDALYKPTEKDLLWLRDNDVLTVIDLRSDREVIQRPCPLKDAAPFEYHHMPMTGGGSLPKSPAEVAPSYIAMADKMAGDIVKLAESSPHRVIYFCSAGKDRTGVISAMLLHRAGARDSEILWDYMLSKDNLKTALEEYCTLSGADINIVTPHEEYIGGFLSWLKKSI